MSEDWPAPESVDDATSTDAPQSPVRTRQSYALRQATVLLAVLVAAAAVVALVLSWTGDDDEPSAVVPEVEVREWDSVVLVDQVAGRLIVAGRDGAELAGGATTLTGLTDVGIDGVVLAGTAGLPSVDGLGVVDLDTGQVELLDVAHDRLTRLDDTGLLVASDGTAATGSVQLVDIARRAVTELAPLAGAGAVVLPDEVRASPSGRHVAFTDLARASTLVLDVATGTTASVAGALADLSADRIATITNRGTTVLVDLADLRGNRVGTVETPPLAGVLIAGPTTGIGVTTAGAVVRIDFADGDSTETARLAPAAPTTSAPGSTAASDQPAAPVVLDTDIVAARQRLAVTLAGAVALVDTGGVVAALLDAALPLPQLDGAGQGARCIHVVGSAVEPSLLIDATTGTKLAQVPAGTLVARSANGCVAIVQPIGSAGSTVIGGGVELDVADPVLAVAPDGSAILLGGVQPRIAQLTDDPVETPLPRAGSTGTFASRGATG